MNMSLLKRKKSNKLRSVGLGLRGNTLTRIADGLMILMSFEALGANRRCIADQPEYWAEVAGARVFQIMTQDIHPKGNRARVMSEGTHYG